MFMSRPINRRLTVVFAILLLAGANAAIKADETKSLNPGTNSQTASLGGIDLTLKRKDDGSVFGEQGKNSIIWGKISYYERDRILKINDTYTKGRALQDLQKLLNGPLGSTVKLVLLSEQHGELSVLELHREALDGRPRENHYNSFSNTGYYFDDQGRNDLRNLQLSEFVRLGCRLPAAAIVQDILNGSPYRTPSIYNGDIVETLPIALKLFDESAMFKQSAAARQKAVRLAKQPTNTFLKVELTALTETANYLLRTGKPEDGEAIFHSLMSSMNEGKQRDKAIILKSYGEALAATGKQDKALPIFKQLEAISVPDDSPWSLKALSSTANFYLAHKDYKSAQILFRNIANRQIHLRRTHTVNFINPEEVANFLNFQKEIETLLLLSRAFEEDGNLEDSIKTLNEALETYSTNLNSEEIIRLERASDLCMSEVESRIANALSKTGDDQGAQKYKNFAASRIKEALGIDFDEYERNKTQIQKGSIPSSEITWREIRDIYEQLEGSNQSDGKNALVNLFKRAQKRNDLSSIEITQLDNLLAAYAKNGDKDFALSKLVWLKTQASRGGPQPVTCSLLSDILFLQKQLGQQNEQLSVTLKELETNLHLLNEEGQPPLPKTLGADTHQDTMFNLLQLRHLASALRYSGSPEKAELLYQHVLKKELTYESVKTVITLELAACQVEQGNFATATALLTELKPSSLTNNECFEKTVQLALALNNAGKNDKAEAFLALLKPMNSNNRASTNSILQSRLGSLETRLGKYANAIETLTNANKGYITGLYSGRDLGKALEALQRNDEAIIAFLNAAKAERQQLIFREGPKGLNTISQALDLMDAQKQVNLETVKCLNDAIQTTSPDEESAKISEQIRSVTNKCPSPGSDKEAITALSRLCMRGGQLAKAAVLTNSSQGKEKPGVVDFEASNALQTLEIKNKDYDKLADALISMLKKASEGSYPFLMPHPGNRKGDLKLDTFEKAKRLDLAEKVLKYASMLDERAHSNFTAVNQLNTALLSDIYAKENKAAESLASAEKVLKAYQDNPKAILGENGMGVSLTLHVLFWTIDSLLQVGNTQAAERLAQRINVFFDSYIGQMNPDRIEILLRQAKIKKATGDKQEQLKFIERAMQLSSWNWGPDSRRTTSVRQDYAAALRDLGETEKADKVDAIHTPPSRNAPDSLIYANRRFGSHGQLVANGVFLDNAEEPLKTQLQDNIRFYGTASRETLDTIAQLRDYYQQKGDLQQIVSLLKRELAVWKELEGKRGQKQAAVMIELARIYSEGKEFGEAAELLKSAERADYTGASPNKINSAEVYIKLGNVADARKLLLSVAKEYTHPDISLNTNQEFAKLLYLLQECKETDEKIRLTDLYKNSPARSAAPGFFPNRAGGPYRKLPVYSYSDGIWVKRP